MATRKPSPIAKHIEIVISAAGLLVFLLVIVISVSKLLSLPAASPQDVAQKSKAWESFYSKRKKTDVVVPPAADLGGELNAETRVYQPPQANVAWLFDVPPYIHLPMQAETAFFIGKALLTAEPGFNTVKVAVRFTEIDNTFDTQSPTTGAVEKYPHLPPDQLDVKIFRGEKTPSGEINWGLEPYTAAPTAEKGVFAWDDTGRVKGVTELFYRAQAQSKQPFLDARQLKPGLPAPAPAQGQPVPIPTLKGEEVLAVTTLAPWSVDVAQNFVGTNVNITILDLRTQKQTVLNAVQAGDVLDDTTYRLINIINIKRFIITIHGNITKIELAMFVINAVDPQKVIDVPIPVWEADPLAPPADNAAIISDFTRQALDVLARVALNMGGGEFDYDNNFIANILWRAVLTYPPAESGKLKDALGREVRQCQFDPGGGASPVKLFPYVFTVGVDPKESVVLHIDPALKDGKVKYWVEYSKSEGANITTVVTGPYQTALPKDFNMSPSDKVKRLVDNVLSPDVQAKLKSGVFATAVEPKPNLTPVGPVPLYDRTVPVDGIGATSDDIGMKAKLGAPMKVVIQYVDTNIPKGAKLLDAPIVPREKYVPAAAPPPVAPVAEDVFNQNLAKRFVLPDKNPKYENIERAANVLSNNVPGIKVVLDQSVKFEGWDKIAFTVQLDNNDVSVNEFLPKLIEAFNRAIKGNDAAGGRQLAREDHPATNEIVLTLQ